MAPCFASVIRLRPGMLSTIARECPPRLPGAPELVADHPLIVTGSTCRGTGGRIAPIPTHPHPRRPEGDRSVVAVLVRRIL